MMLQGCNVIISGASQGLGLEVAKKFVAEGASIMMCARSLNALQKAQAEVLENAPTHCQVLIQQTDVSDLKQVESLVLKTIAELGHVDALVANAGVYGTKGPIEEIDWNEWSEAIDINLKGTVWQSRAVIPHFKSRSKGKIIILSGGGATKPMPFLSAYAASKAAVVRFAETLAEEVKSFNIDVNAIAPGALNTRMLNEILEAGPEKVGIQYYENALKQKKQGGTPLDVGANLCAFLASAQSDGITGRLISAVWDPWLKLPARLEELQQSDVYTLRRIVPEDRGLVWDDVL